MGQQLLTRYGVVTREVAGAEGLPGGFSAIHEVFRTLEESGRIRRGYFVSGVGAMQFAAPAAVDLLRALRTPSETADVAVLSATDPANPYGALVKWPESPGTSVGRGPTRSVGARVVLVDGHLTAWIARGLRSLLVWLPEHDPERSRHAEALARVLPVTGTDPDQRSASILVAGRERRTCARCADPPVPGGRRLRRHGTGPAVARHRKPRPRAATATSPGSMERRRPRRRTAGRRRRGGRPDSVATATS